MKNTNNAEAKMTRSEKQLRTAANKAQELWLTLMKLDPAVAAKSDLLGRVEEVQSALSRARTKELEAR